MLLPLQVAAGIEQLGDIGQDAGGLHVLDGDGDEAHVHDVKGAAELGRRRGEEVPLVVGDVWGGEVLRGKLLEADV